MIKMALIGVIAEWTQIGGCGRPATIQITRRTSTIMAASMKMETM